ncbi:tetratricopeptide repeat protein [Mycobacterium sp. Marseille-P9652]|uniref:tetratricopeptide repeat protein n=1 Tax=Mycobacterium sp. Marseille-P9652 TaxID=2654950 RepID=UPI0012E71FDD|nr:tetratricopeptide repeat protein [Mycobacterium sp. Marseille-P9652]
MTSGLGVDQGDDVLRLASAYFDSKNYERARDVIRRGLAQHPNDPALLARHAQAEIALGNYQAAAHSAYAALGASPQDEFAMRLYAWSLAGLGRSKDALWMAWRGVLAHPNEPLQHLTYARLLHAGRHQQFALQEIDQALRLNPVSVDALVLRGSILHELNRIPESDACYRAALELDPGNAEALNNLAVNRLQRGRLSRALRGFLGAAGSDPALGELARSNIGVVLRKVLMVVTIVAAVLGFLVAFAAVLHGEGRPTGALRGICGVLTAAIAVVLAWIARTIPRNVLASVLRQRYFAAVRLLHAVTAVVAGLWVVVYPGPQPLVAIGVVLAVSGFIVFRLGLFTGK